MATSIKSTEFAPRNPYHPVILSIVRAHQHIIRHRAGRMVNRTGRYAAFGHPDTCIRCLCEDGKRRTVRLGIDADSYFSWPGRASIGGRTVRGYVTGRELLGQKAYAFITYKAKG